MAYKRYSLEKRLISAVAHQIGISQEDEYFPTVMSDIDHHGINTGVSGFTWTSDLVDFYLANRKLINAIFVQFMEDIGGEISDMKSWECIDNPDLSLVTIARAMYAKANRSNYDYREVYAALANFAGEHAAYLYQSDKETNE